MVEYLEGTTAYNVSNKYYWFTLGENKTGAEFTEIDGQNVLCNYMDVNTDSSIDGYFNPEVGDNLVQLGNRQDETRQSAIILSAYKNIDVSIEALSKCMSPSTMLLTGMCVAKIDIKRVLKIKSIYALSVNCLLCLIITSERIFS